MIHCARLTNPNVSRPPASPLTQRHRNNSNNERSVENAAVDVLRRQKYCSGPPPPPLDVVPPASAAFFTSSRCFSASPIICARCCACVRGLYLRLPSSTALLRNRQKRDAQSSAAPEPGTTHAHCARAGARLGSPNFGSGCTSASLSSPTKRMRDVRSQGTSATRCW